MHFKRRQFLQAGVAGVVSAAVPAIAATPVRKRMVGHTGITWGYGPEQAPLAIAEVGQLGYQGFESFGPVLKYWDSRGGLQEALHKANVPLIAAYCPLVLTDAGKRAEEVAKAQRWGALIKHYGGSIAVIGPDNVDRQQFDFDHSSQTIIESLDAIGSALQDIGITAALHQHTGSCVMTSDELHAVVEGVNLSHMKLCLDTGELQAAGIDPVLTIMDFVSLISHVHLKDYNAGPDHDGFCPLGEGKVEMPAILDLLEASSHPYMLMAELNPAAPGAADQRSAGELAAVNRQSLERWGYLLRKK